MPKGHGIYNFCRPFLGHHYYTLSLCGPCFGVEKVFFRNVSILHFLPQNYTPLSWGLGHLQILVSLPYRCLKTNLVKTGPVVLEKMLTHDPSDSGDLKIRLRAAQWFTGLSNTLYMFLLMKAKNGYGYLRKSKPKDKSLYITLVNLFYQIENLF